ncbi:putative eka-like protein [Erysiphe necator]|uniref:Putative eka-like protein n=1 Tax=Uncinula necator TaxID=52586 RepID=A0A0B1PBQ1_UNCNE|nr:putative eka-like protein [Erysiphe necator]
MTKKIAVVTPQIVLMARKGVKKARIVNCNNTQVSTGNKNVSRVFDKDNSSKPVSDKRLFVRLPQEHEWRKLSPAGIREVVAKKLAISPTLIGRIKPLNSGFAPSPCSTEARDKILNAGNGVFLSGAKLEAATNWVSVLISTAPAYIRKEQGVVEVSNTMLADEVERVCSVRPAHLKLYGRNKAEAPHLTWMVFFSKAPRGSFKVFDESGVARPFKKQQPLEFCKRCNDHHPTKKCSRALSCGNCGSTNLSKDLYMAVTKCRNCGGLHRSDSRRCLARPTRSGAPTKEQLKTYRQAGEREFHALLRAKVAEEFVATAESTNDNVLSSQVTQPQSNIDNSLAPSFNVINFLSINVGRGSASQDIAMARTCELKIDILLIQEPWWSSRTKTHPYYDLYLPFGGENIRPRAAIYVRKDPKRIIVKQVYPLSLTGDYCWVGVNDIMFLNIYKAPHDSTAVQPLLAWTPTSKTVAIGDFNSIYWAWQPCANSFYGQG